MRYSIALVIFAALCTTTQANAQRTPAGRGTLIFNDSRGQALDPLLLDSVFNVAVNWDAPDDTMTMVWPRLRGTTRMITTFQPTAIHLKALLDLVPSTKGSLVINRTPSLLAGDELKFTNAGIASLKFPTLDAASTQRGCTFTLELATMTNSFPARPTAQTVTPAPVIDCSGNSFEVSVTGMNRFPVARVEGAGLRGFLEEVDDTTLNASRYSPTQFSIWLGNNTIQPWLTRFESEKLHPDTVDITIQLKKQRNTTTQTVLELTGRDMRVVGIRRTGDDARPWQVTLRVKDWKVIVPAAQTSQTTSTTSTTSTTPAPPPPSQPASETADERRTSSSRGKFTLVSETEKSVTVTPKSTCGVRTAVGMSMHLMTTTHAFGFNRITQKILAPGTYNVSEKDGDFLVAVMGKEGDANKISEGEFWGGSAESGTVTISRATPKLVSGSFDVTINGGFRKQGQLVSLPVRFTGTFDVPFGDENCM
ncbi:MAG TPA: hypothetical protein VM100_11635 [Longimicrobiales bacterium]|nr:hypothetical protein [Longimicrobiales bacterium]